jgi:hypothetical protein
MCSDEFVELAVGQATAQRAPKSQAEKACSTLSPSPAALLMLMSATDAPAADFPTVTPYAHASVITVVLRC